MSELPVSRKFRYDLDELYTKQKAKEITEEEFSIQRDALIAQEAKLHETIGPLLIAKQLEAIESDVAATVNKKFQQEEREESARVAKERIAKQAEIKRIEREEQEKQNAIEAEHRKKIEDQKNFRLSINTFANNLKYNTDRWHGWSNWLQIVLIVLTTATASMAGYSSISRVYVVVCGWCAAALGGVLSYLQLQDKIYSDRKALADLQLECQMYDYGIDEYKNRDDDPEGAYLLFSKKVTAIQATQMLQEVEFLKPKKKETVSDTKENQKKVAIREKEPIIGKDPQEDVDSFAVTDTEN